jgi:CubicO group peptidase (beta-lactamase class C family)
MDIATMGARFQDIAPEEFSGVISVGVCGGPFVAKAFGLAYRPDRVPNTEKTRFAIASGTKGFTALAVLRLVQEGRISLETALGDVLPDIFSDQARRITILHLLTHVSGIPDYCDEDAGCDYEALWEERSVYAVTQPSDFLPMFAHLPMKSAPGERFSYSNSGYIVLGLVVEAVSGMPYADFVQEEVFKPLGMNRAGYFRSDMLPQDSAVGYINNPDGTFRSNVFAVPVVGAPDGGAFVSAPDMHAFWTGLLAGLCLEGELLDRLLQTALPTNSPKGFLYSLGFWVAPAWAKRKHLFLTGGDPGVSFLSGCCPDNNVHFTILANTERGSSLVMESVIDLLGDARGFA